MRYLYITVAFFLLTACERQLELVAPSELTVEGFWDTENGARAAHSGLYGTLRSSHSTLWLLGEIRSDVWGGQTFESPSNLDLIESNISIANAPFGGWAGLYTNIHRLNDFIANLPEVNFNRSEDRDHMLGQAYGLRAFYYYTLLKTWGAVPLTTEPLATTDPEGLSKPRALESEVMAQIKADLEASLQFFGDDGSFWNGQRIYWSKAATLALMGDAYLWSGTLLNGGADDYREAKAALLAVGDLDVGLLDDYADLWTPGSENNREFIFALNYERDEATNFYSLMTGRSTEIQPQFASDGSSMADYIVNGANRYGPSEKTLLLTDDNDDTRKAATFLRLYSDDNGGAGYAQFTPEPYFGSVINKFDGNVDESIRVMDNNVPLYRYADVLLMLAEAKNLLGEDPSEEINRVRERAYGSAYDPQRHGFENGGQTENTRAILDERYKEFIAEGKRWWDLCRAGDQYVIDNVAFLDADEQYKLLLPITLDMIGRNPLLEQTPGYSE
ncbi:hypothetical protein GGR26_003412 [Lewinella marina]|uniref:RagB/SusD family nutrient uptake outer membrane protein n=1 Tax=Neolewinella marina TaxID=438751 RepID=A0A2G0CCI2_9BACT|nr:RagB/SusD family nutrient uptake outer membrane protein [Neolewinella marina]NJB87628.1 hypothetical protein [Neolewinella marina]PHK97684.1 RagB/SusD family nutrient uptake outer membrane protein [Neolewinella marina]